MQYQANSVQHYIDQLPEERKEPIKRLVDTVKSSIPEGFAEDIGYGMIGFCVPHSIYPNGYHCNPKDPLPFIGIASQKNFIAFYHMGIYMDKKLLDWFLGEYPMHCKSKLDMGKSCIRFKKTTDIPYELIGQLASKMTVADWILMYELTLNKEND